MKCYFEEDNIYYAYDKYQGAFIAKSEEFLINVVSYLGIEEIKNI